MNGSIGLFATGDFIRVDVLEWEFYKMRVALLMGVMLLPDGMTDNGFRLVGLLNGPEGQFVAVPMDAIKSDFVYDVGRDRFQDASAETPPDDDDEALMS
jgi:hypothetical protein